MKTINLRLKQKMDEVFFVEPVDLRLGFLTRIYKTLTSPLKDKPFIILIPISLLVASLLYFIFGPLVVKLVSLLQYGF